MAFEFSSRIRYSELDADKQLSLVSLVDYFQDCSTFQSESLGRGLDYLAEKERAWMVLFWQIEIVRRPKLGELVTAQTWPSGFKAFYGYRNFTLLDEQQQYLAKADSVWAYIDTQSGRPTKVLPENMAGYVCEEPLDMEKVPRKLQIPDGCTAQESFAVGRQHLDSNNHVNNGQYIYMAQEYLPEGFEVSKLKVEYRQQARLHDVVVPMVQAEETRITVCLCDVRQKPYAIVVFEADSQEQNQCQAG